MKFWERKRTDGMFPLQIYIYASGPSKSYTTSPFFCSRTRHCGLLKGLSADLLTRYTLMSFPTPPRERQNRGTITSHRVAHAL